MSGREDLVALVRANLDQVKALLEQMERVQEEVSRNRELIAACRWPWGRARALAYRNRDLTAAGASLLDEVERLKAANFHAMIVIAGGERP